MYQHRAILFTIFTIIILGLASGASAQNAPAPEGIPVHMTVTAEPRHGGNVPSIAKTDVIVSEGKDRDTVSDWVPAQGDQAALEMFILLDDGSNASLGSQLQDLRQFINAQPSSTKVGVAYMQNGIARIVQDLTTDHAQAAKALRLPMGTPDADASPYFAVSDLVKKWPASNARHEVFMASDGIDRYYGGGDLQDPYLATAIHDAQRAGVIFFAIYTPSVGHFGHDYWQTYWGQLYLAQLADQTGGESYYIGFNGPPVSFSPYLDDVSHRLQHQYLLTFLAKPPKKAGMQKVKVRTEVQNVDMVAPSEVYVPMEPQ